MDAEARRAARLYNHATQIDPWPRPVVVHPCRYSLSMLQSDIILLFVLGFLRHGLPPRTHPTAGSATVATTDLRQHGNHLVPRRGRGIPKLLPVFRWQRCDNLLTVPTWPPPSGLACRALRMPLYRI